MSGRCCCLNESARPRRRRQPSAHPRRALPPCQAPSAPAVWLDGVAFPGQALGPSRGGPRRTPATISPRPWRLGRAPPRFFHPLRHRYYAPISPLPLAPPRPKKQRRRTLILIASVRFDGERHLLPSLPTIFPGPAERLVKWLEKPGRQRSADDNDPAPAPREWRAGRARWAPRSPLRHCAGGARCACLRKLDRAITARHLIIISSLPVAVVRVANRVKQCERHLPQPCAAPRAA